MAKPHYWFRRKHFGWGLEPGSREGWIATILFFVGSVGGVFALMLAKAGPTILIAWAFAWIAAFVGVVIVKGEEFR